MERVCRVYIVGSPLKANEVDPHGQSPKFIRFPACDEGSGPESVGLRHDINCRGELPRTWQRPACALRRRWLFRVSIGVYSAFGTAIAFPITLVLHLTKTTQYVFTLGLPITALEHYRLIRTIRPDPKPPNRSTILSEHHNTT